MKAIAIIVVVLIVSYSLGALPGYLWFLRRKPEMKVQTSDIAVILVPSPYTCAFT